MAPLTDMSQEHLVALLSDEERADVLDGVNMDDLAYDWLWNGRPSQILPVLPTEGGDEWTLAMALAGRGFG